MPSKPSLADYHKKRDPGATPEPFSGTRPTGGSVFVIHHHWARAHHYDLRLEVDGMLWSWAVPKGPALDPADKRLAVQVEPHPVDYAWFEGRIPEGNYGAGAMIIWDRGRWVPLIEPHQGMAEGKMLFELRGHKLHGTWTLVRTKGGSGRQWLLIKERDGWVGRIPEPPMDSVVSGLTVEQLREGQGPEESLVRAMRRAGAPAAGATRPRPMLCQPGEPFSAPGWWFEIKYDGYRVMARRHGERVQLLTRSGRDIAGNFPEVSEALAYLPATAFILDGELTVTNAEGLPDFAGLQQRGQLTRPADIARGALARPATLFSFDLVAFAGMDLTAQPLSRRKRWLQRLLPGVGTVRYVDHIVGQGEAAFEQAQALRLEGLVAKRKDSPYQPGVRSADWIKLAALKTADFVVMGWVPDDNTAGFRALVVGQHNEEGLVGCGRVGSGLDLQIRSELYQWLSAHRRPGPAGEASGPRATRWVEPETVVEVRYKEFTPGGQLRQPVLLRWRTDKPAEDCRRGVARGERVEPAEVAAPEPPPRVIESNRDKVFFPDGTTKGQVLDHYRAIAPFMLPWLKDRPIVMTRYPDGVDGKFFFQHEAPDFLPDWIRTEPVRHSEGVVKHHIIIDDADTLRYVANLGTLPIHTWAARLDRLEQPDYCILDLDPKTAPLVDVVKVARALKHLCDEVGLPVYPKTSGSTGLHLLIPLDGQLDHEQSRSLAEVLARVVCAREPEIATIQRATQLRGGRVYVDYGQNGRGKTIAAAFCAREVAAATVSMPLKWSEVTARLRLERYTVRNAARRMQRLGEDPCAPALGPAPDLAEVLGRLGELM